MTLTFYFGGYIEENYENPTDYKYKFCWLFNDNKTKQVDVDLLIKLNDLINNYESKLTCFNVDKIKDRDDSLIYEMITNCNKQLENLVYKIEKEMPELSKLNELKIGIVFRIGCTQFLYEYLSNKYHTKVEVKDKKYSFFDVMSLLALNKSFKETIDILDAKKFNNIYIIDSWNNANISTDNTIKNDSWNWILGNSWNEFSSLIDKDITKLHGWINLRDSKTITIEPDLKKIGQVYKYMSKLEYNIFNFLYISNNLKLFLNNKKINENNIDSCDNVLTYCNLFVSFLFELLKPYDFEKAQSKMEENFGIDLFYAVNDVKWMIDNHFIAQAQIESGKLKNKFNIYKIFEEKTSKETDGIKHKYIFEFANLKPSFNGFIWDIARNTRNSTFHPGLMTANKWYDDSNNYLFGFLVNYSKQYKKDFDQCRSLAIKHIEAVEIFIKKTFQFCWESMHCLCEYVTPGKKIIESIERKIKEGK